MASCATSTGLTAQGESVQYQENVDPTADVTLIATVQTKNKDSAVSAVNDLRNQTAELGGDYLIIDIISNSVRQNIMTDLVETVYSASGRAYTR